MLLYYCLRVRSHLTRNLPQLPCHDTHGNGSQKCDGIQNKSQEPGDAATESSQDTGHWTCCTYTCTYVLNNGETRDPTSFVKLSLPTYLRWRSSSRVKAKNRTSVGTDSIMRLVSTKPFIHSFTDQLSHLKPSDFFFAFSLRPSISNPVLFLSPSRWWITYSVPSDSDWYNIDQSVQSDRRLGSRSRLCINASSE